VLLHERGIPVLPHAVSLSLGSADPVDVARVEHLAAVAEAVGSRWSATTCASCGQEASAPVTSCPFHEPVTRSTCWSTT
jgi:uncharacterized protein (UPF0276 family)